MSAKQLAALANIAVVLPPLWSHWKRHGAADVPITVKAFNKEAHFVFSVANGGDPIPLAARERHFQPFARGDVRKSQSGLGLGLFIVGEIARAHGGTVGVRSSDEETRFTFTMPLEHE